MSLQENCPIFPSYQRKHFPRILFSASVFSTVALFVMLFAGAVGSYRHQTVDEERFLRIEELFNKAILYEEVLSSSAYLYAWSSEASWWERYAQFHPLLDEQINFLESASDTQEEKNLAAQTKRSNDASVDMELQVVRMVDGGRPMEARGLLLEAEYQRQRADYRMGITKWHAMKAEKIRRNRFLVKYLALATMVLGFFFACVIGAIWLITIRFIRLFEGEKKLERQATMRTLDLYLHFFDATPNGLFLINAKTFLVENASSFFQKTLGYSHEDVIGKKIGDVPFFRESPEEMSCLEQLREKKEAWCDTHVIPAKDGRPLWVEGRGVRFVMDQSDMICWSLYNVTDRVQAEQELMNAKNQFESFVEKSHDAVLILQEGVLKYANCRAFEMVGYTSNELLGRSIFPLIDPRDRQMVMARYDARVKGEAVPIEYPCRVQTKDGHLIQVDIGAALVEFEGRPAVMAILRDVTVRKKVEEDLSIAHEKIEEGKKRLELALQSGKIGIWDLDLHTNQMTKISRYDEIFGYQQFQPNWDMETFFHHVHVEDRDRVKREINSALKTGTLKTQCRIVWRDGSIHWIEQVGIVVDNGDKTAKRMIGMTRDITQQAELDQMKTEFVAVVSHQLRTPLTGIKWVTELLAQEKAGGLPPKQREYVSQIHESNERMIKLVNDLLDVSHIETGNKYRIALQKENLDQSMREVVEANREIAAEKKIGLYCRHEESRARQVRVDKQKIQQVMQNLLSNAIKYSEPGSRIDVLCKMSDHEVIYQVKDRGLGIPSHQQSRVFEKFFRADNVMTRESGTGLGLYIAKAIVEGHGGKIWFESKEGEGSTFSFSLPLNVS